MKKSLTDTIRDSAWNEVGPRTHYAILRMPRDFASNSLIAFTARQMADGDCDLFSESVPAGQKWLINFVSFVPNSPMDFNAFRNLCVTYPMGFLKVLVPNTEALGEIPLSWFWQDGEYILKPRFSLSNPIALLEMSQFRVKISLPESASNTIPAPEKFLKTSMERAAFRVMLHVNVWGKY